MTLTRSPATRTGVPTRTRGRIGRPRTEGQADARRATRAGYAALGWVVLFFAFHVYWYLGGSFASPGNLPPIVPHSLVAWITEPVDSAWLIGPLVCLAIARGWARGRLALPAATLVWFGCVLLLLRGGAGLIDDLTRASGLLRNGITGLSTKETTGHADLRWADWAIDSYFLAGGIIFGLLAIWFRAQRRHSRQGAASAQGAWLDHPQRTRMLSAPTPSR